MSVFVHAQCIKLGGGKKWQNTVHVVVECPLILLIEVARYHIVKFRTIGGLTAVQ